MKKKRYTRAMGLFLSLLLLLLCLPVPDFMRAEAVTTDELQSQIDALKNNAAGLITQKRELENQLKSIRGEKAQAMARKENLEQQIGVLREEIDLSDALIAQYNAYIAEKEAELAETEKKEAIQYELFCERVRAMEETGTVSYWSILFDAADFSDLLDRATYVNEVMSYDQEIMDMLAQTRMEIAAAKEDLESKRTEQEEVRTAQAAKRDELQAQAAEVDRLVDEISADEDALERAEAELQAAAKEMDRQLAAKQKELEAKLADGSVTIDPGTGYKWPLAGKYTLSSLFGGRIDPITGKPATHTGIDIPAAKNTPILAARGGVVLTSTYYGSYGNYVSISHGNGDSTLYAHMNSRAVKEGAVVKQGDVIGYVGTTGRSTGNHLHFEVRINGTRQDPVSFYPSLTLYYISRGRTVRLDH
ncbi:MAG: peptidoglycan DD-metalloendopeptidase family protein [Clostridiales bacterium]|nr:peptidoglycan DD-metalloendopeptidase family protein [Clostridiales bacterium]